MTGAHLLLVSGCAALAAATALWVPRLPEPEPDGDGIRANYQGLRGPLFWGPGTLLGALAGASLGQTPGWIWPIGVGLAGPGAALALTDLRTTYLPLPVTRVCAVMSGVGFALCLASAPAAGALAVRVVAASLATAALFWLFWRLGGLGFGDVRLAPLVAMTPAALSWAHWYQSLLASTLLGAAAGLSLTVWRRRHPSQFGTVFAYGPWLWAGPWVALLLG